MYSLTIKNQSGAKQTVSLFQTSLLNPSFSVVWLQQLIFDQATCYFKWDANKFALGFGELNTLLTVGTQYTNTYYTAVYPQQSQGKNQLEIGYEANSFFQTSLFNNPNLEIGDLQITTNTSFTVKQSLNFAVGMYMDGKPILIAQGAPNTAYQFYTNNCYYLTISNYPIGSVLPPIEQITTNNFLLGSMTTNVKKRTIITQSMSKPILIDISKEQPNLSFTINENLIFQPIS